MNKTTKKISTKHTKGKTDNQVIKEALYKKAMGYVSQEIIEEYITQDDNLVLSKRKVTSKEIPPDIPAVKTLIELIGMQDDITNLTDEQLEQERTKLLQLLAEQNCQENNPTKE